MNARQTTSRPKRQPLGHMTPAPVSARSATDRKVKDLQLRLKAAETDRDTWKELVHVVYDCARFDAKKEGPLADGFGSIARGIQNSVAVEVLHTEKNMPPARGIRENGSIQLFDLDDQTSPSIGLSQSADDLYAILTSAYGDVSHFFRSGNPVRPLCLLIRQSRTP